MKFLEFFPQSIHDLLHNFLLKNLNLSEIFQSPILYIFYLPPCRADPSSPQSISVFEALLIDHRKVILYSNFANISASLDTGDSLFTKCYLPFRICKTLQNSHYFPL